MTITVTPSTITLNNGTTLSTTYASREGVNVTPSGSNLVVNGRVSFGGSNNSVDFIDWNNDYNPTYNVPGTVRAKTHPVTRPSNIIGQFRTTNTTNIVNARNWLFSNINAGLGKETSTAQSYTIGMGTDRYATSVSATMNMSVLPSVVDVPGSDMWSQSTKYTIFGINMSTGASYGSYTSNGNVVTTSNIADNAMSVLTYRANIGTVSSNLTSVSSLGYSFTKTSANYWSAQMVHALPGEWAVGPTLYDAPASAQTGTTVNPVATFDVQKWDLIFVTQVTPRDVQVIFRGLTSGPVQLITGRGGRWYVGGYTAVYIATEDGTVTYTGDATNTGGDTTVYDPYNIVVLRSSFKL